jgi:hypothetical protein
MRRLHTRLAAITLTLALAGAAAAATPAFASTASPAPTRGQAASGWLAIGWLSPNDHQWLWVLAFARTTP